MKQEALFVDLAGQVRDAKLAAKTRTSWESETTQEIKRRMVAKASLLRSLRTTRTGLANSETI